ncbi:hypothetical protein B6N60_01883 [Richelia sinica FACHB-800]|uniref:D-alanyl-D-alanine carboxypeptidase/D-alanyl-D-alanine-endopeptidase n=2 Tax=Richelia TaxID=98443 RepID=A0A975T6T6_9NOST|nr:hypothetical protein B6N60_01883 [Richelia sinica FACHB-800]
MSFYFLLVKLTMNFKNITLSLIFLSINLQITTNQQIAQSQTPPPVNTFLCPAQLNSSIPAIINNPLFRRVRWGILIQDISSQQTLYSQDAEKFFIPASNTKLLTTAAALKELGSQFRFRTSIYQEQDGAVRIVGRGDPSLTEAKLKLLAQQLKQKGITAIKNLILDDSYIQGDIVNPTWQWEDVQSDYGAPVSSFILNENTFSFHIAPQNIGQPPTITGKDNDEIQQWDIINQAITVPRNQETSIEINRDLSGKTLRIRGQIAANSQPYVATLPVIEPNQYFLRRFLTILASEQITVDKTSISSSENYQNEIAFIESPPLSELLKETNVNSNNLYAESLLKALAIKKTKQQNLNSADVGLEVLKNSLNQLGITPDSYLLADGSGLSRRNLISPEALVKTLQAIAKTPEASIYRVSLPISGKNGTLKQRFRNTSAEGIVQAKTGTLRGAVSLSGYVNPPQYEPLVFSIIVNQSDQPSPVLRTAIDEIVILLTQLKKC